MKANIGLSLKIFVAKRGQFSIPAKPSSNFGKSVWFKIKDKIPTWRHLAGCINFKAER